MKKKIKVFKIIAIILGIILTILLLIGIYLHISDLIAMRECAKIEECMYCVPARMIIAYIIYAICFVLLNIDIIFIILYFTVKRKIKDV